MNHSLKSTSMVLLGMALASPLFATIVPLQNATATYSQDTFPVTESINGVINGDTDGWAIFDFSANPSTNQTAVYESVADLNYALTQLTFTLNHQFNQSDAHTLGRFRLSITTDPRSAFADGSVSGGDVTANWTVLDIVAASSAMPGVTLAELGDHSILVSGANPLTNIYTIVANTSVSGITGFRLEALSDPSLPTSGPGRASNGNFVLSEFAVDAVDIIPEPSTILLLGVGGALLWRRRRASRPGGEFHDPL